jgi:hypothetical protein
VILIGNQLSVISKTNNKLWSRSSILPVTDYRLLLFPLDISQKQQY